MCKSLLALLGLLLFSSTKLFAVEEPTRREKEIQHFASSDKTNPPPQGAVLFVGSSSIRLWKTLAADFPRHRVINRGFGGSQLDDSVHYFNRIIAPYNPKLIVLYAGGNDINAGKSPAQIFDAFTNFVAKTHKTLPETRVAYISIAPNPARWSQVARVKAANQLIKEFTEKDEKLAFINVFPAMLGKNGNPKPDIFQKDGLHMNAQGYAIWRSLVQPYLEQFPARE